MACLLGFMATLLWNEIIKRLRCWSKRILKIMVKKRERVDWSGLLGGLRRPRRLLSTEFHVLCQQKDALDYQEKTHD
jgi:hypothetical protein